MTKTFRCWKHGGDWSSDTGCGKCADELAAATDPATMSLEARIEECRRWVSKPATVQFSAMWPRLNALVGRSTWNHEWAEPESIYAEMRGEREWDGPLGSLQRIAPGKPIIVMEKES